MPETPPVPTPEEPRDHAPTVVDGVLARTSVSAMQKGDPATGGCLRAWWYRYGPLHLDSGTGRGAELGKAGHRRIERYLRGQGNGLAKTELVGLHRLPAPSPDLLVEWPLEGHLTAAGVPMVGFLDCVDPTARVISDWKFKADLDRWASKPADLVDPMSPYGMQMLAYHVAVGNALGDKKWQVRHVNFRHTGRHEATETKAPLTPLAEVVNKWQEVATRVIPNLQAAASVVDPESQSVPCNTSACGKFGGCPYKYPKGPCTPPAVSLQALFQIRGSQMGLISSLSKSAPIAVPAVVPPATVTPGATQVVHFEAPPLPTAGTVVKCLMGQVYTLPDGRKGTYTGDSKDLYFFAIPGEAQQVRLERTANVAPLVATMSLPSLPPAAVPYATEAQTVAPANPAPPKRGRARKAKGDDINPPDAAQAVASPAPVVDPVVARGEAMPATTGTTTGATPGATTGATPVPAPVPALTFDDQGTVMGRETSGITPVPAPVPALTFDDQGTVMGRETSGIYLYYGCAPLGVECVPLSIHTLALEGVMRQELQIQAKDLRLAKGEEYGFGKWRAYLAACALAQPPAAGHYYVTTGDERVMVVADALVAIAALVVVS